MAYVKMILIVLIVSHVAPAQSSGLASTQSSSLAPAQSSSLAPARASGSTSAQPIEKRFLEEEKDFIRREKMAILVEQEKRRGLEEFLNKKTRNESEMRAKLQLYLAQKQKDRNRSPAMDEETYSNFSLEKRALVDQQYQRARRLDYEARIRDIEWQETKKEDIIRKSKSPGFVRSHRKPWLN